MGYSQNPDVIISQQRQLIGKQDETLTLRDQFIEQQQEKLQTLLSMCQAYETTIKLTMSYAKAIKEPGLYTLIEESLRQGKVTQDEPRCSNCSHDLVVNRLGNVDYGQCVNTECKMHFEIVWLER